MSIIDTFTLEQKDTYKKIEKLNEIVKDSFDPTKFVLNEKVVEAMEEINSLQKKCKHIWHENVCVVCGKVWEAGL